MNYGQEINLKRVDEMPDDLQTQLFAELQKLNDRLSKEIHQFSESLRGEMDDRHHRLRSDLTGGFGEISAQLAAHTREDTQVRDRVLRIEVQRETEKTYRDEQIQRALVKSSIQAGIIAAGIAAIVEIVLHFIK